MPAPIRIGTSGWEYRHWAGDFYPKGLPRGRWLEHYAHEFDTVELNNPFYRLPSADVFEAWRGRVPTEFRFAVKASRYLTHLKRLRDPEEPLERFWNRASRLESRLGPVLYQLPPRWRPNQRRMADFLAALPGHPQAIEFRDRRWYGPMTFALLVDAGVALCLHDMAGSSTPPKPVGPFVYVRFHGSGERYGGRYPSQRLSAWARRMVDWADAGLPVWAYFNNDIGGHAFRDADRLRSTVARRLDR
ncbi:MAG TPA: DUF72 domain-containing protein [Candidatus Limnocylindria bacterium]|nr:DUF72 domain-containing protein [Candidatus Limnocylindria bacterium]